MRAKRAHAAVRRLVERRPNEAPDLRPVERAAQERGVLVATRYVYRVTDVEKVTDGDTFWLRLDVGFRQSMLCHLRLFGWDTPEKYRGSEHEKQEAKRATDLVAIYLHTALIDGDPLWVRTEADPDNFGRWLGDVWIEDGENPPLVLGEYLHEHGLASRWPTRWREEFDTSVASASDTTGGPG